MSRIGCSRFFFASRFPWLRVSNLYRPSLLCMPFSAKLINEIMIIIIIICIPECMAICMLNLPNSLTLLEEEGDWPINWLNYISISKIKVLWNQVELQFYSPTLSAAYVQHYIMLYIDTGSNNKILHVPGLCTSYTHLEHS